MAVPKKKKSKSKTRSRRAGAWKLGAPGPQPLPALRKREDTTHVCPTCGWYKNRVAVDVA